MRLLLALSLLFAACEMTEIDNSLQPLDARIDTAPMVTPDGNYPWNYAEARLASLDGAGEVILESIDPSDLSGNGANLLLFSSDYVIAAKVRFEANSPELFIGATQVAATPFALTQRIPMVDTWGSGAVNMVLPTPVGAGAQGLATANGTLTVPGYIASFTLPVSAADYLDAGGGDVATWTARVEFFAEGAILHGPVAQFQDGGGITTARSAIFLEVSDYTAEIQATNTYTDPVTGAFYDIVGLYEKK